MIYLLIDIGNSRIKWGLFRSADIEPILTDAFEYKAHPVSEIQSLLDKHLAPLQKPDHSMLASVGTPAITRQLEDWLTEHWQPPQRLHTTAAECGVNNAYTSSAVLGTDRWAALIAAHALYPHSVLIVSCGTALTLDLLHKNGQHYGGFIVPGLNLMYRALHQETHQLPLVTDEASGAEFANNTGQAISGGCLLALAGAIEKALRTAKAQLNQQPHCILTGGHASKLLPHISAPLIHEPHLVLKGMAVVLNQTALNQTTHRQPS